MPLISATITGTGFQPGITTVQLRRSGTTISAAGITVVSPTQISCTFTIPYNAPINTDYYVPGDKPRPEDWQFRQYVLGNGCPGPHDHRHHAE